MKFVADTSMLVSSEAYGVRVLGDSKIYFCLSQLLPHLVYFGSLMC